MSCFLCGSWGFSSNHCYLLIQGASQGEPCAVQKLASGDLRVSFRPSKPLNCCARDGGCGAPPMARPKRLGVAHCADLAVPGFGFQRGTCFIYLSMCFFCLVFPSILVSSPSWPCRLTILWSTLPELRELQRPCARTVLRLFCFRLVSQAGYRGVSMDILMDEQRRTFDFTSDAGYVPAPQLVVFLKAVARTALQAVRLARAGSLFVIAINCNSFCLPRRGE